MVLDQAAGLDQPGVGQPVEADHHPRPELDGADAAVGLARDERADLEAAVADPDAVADRDPEAHRQRALDRSTRHAAAALEQRRRRESWGQRGLDVERAVERVDAVDRLELDQGALGAIFGARHRAHLDPLRQGRGALRQPVELGRRRGAMQQAQGDVAAQDHARVALEPGDHRGRKPRMPPRSSRRARRAASAQSPPSAVRRRPATLTRPPPSASTGARRRRSARRRCGSRGRSDWPARGRG